VLPTLSDGFALSQLEAMACGVPVVATPACGDVVEHGVNGWRVAAGDVDAAAGLLRDIAANPAQLPAMRVVAQERACEFPLARPFEVLEQARQDWHLREDTGPIRA